VSRSSSLNIPQPTQSTSSQKPEPQSTKKSEYTKESLKIPKYIGVPSIEITDSIPSTQKRVKTKKRESVRKLQKRKELPRLDCKDVKKAPGFKNEGETCYIDSVLYLLLVVFDKFTRDYIYNTPKDDNSCDRGAIVEQLKIAQNELLTGNDNQICSNFRQAINACVGRKFKNSGDDPSRFLAELFKIFNIVFFTEVFTQHSNNDISEGVHENHFMYIDMDDQQENVPLSSFGKTVTTKTGPSNNVVRETTYLSEISPPLLVLYLNRRKEDEEGNEVRILTPVEVSEHVADKTLHAIVSFQDNHVVAFFKFKETNCDYTWYVYNDSEFAEKRVFHIGTLNDVLNVKSFNPRTNGILFFYWDKNTNPTAWTT
jgi:hypothetical protein